MPYLWCSTVGTKRSLWAHTGSLTGCIIWLISLITLLALQQYKVRLKCAQWTLDLHDGDEALGAKRQLTRASANAASMSCPGVSTLPARTDGPWGFCLLAPSWRNPWPLNFRSRPRINHTSHTAIGVLAWKKKQQSEKPCLLRDGDCCFAKTVHFFGSDAAHYTLSSYAVKKFCLHEYKSHSFVLKYNIQQVGMWLVHRSKNPWSSVYQLSCTSSRQPITNNCMSSRQPITNNWTSSRQPITNNWTSSRQPITNSTACHPGSPLPTQLLQPSDHVIYWIIWLQTILIVTSDK